MGKHFKKGNEFWKQRSSHGPKPIFDDPEVLRAACLEYFQWAHDNPLYETRAFAHKGRVTKKKLPKMRAMTNKHLCIFLDIASSTWDAYCEKPDFIDVTKWARDVIETQKFQGAAAGLLQANLVARDLGMKESVEVNAPEMTPWNSVTAGVDET